MRIDNIKIKNFKAFRAEEVFDFESKHILMYGNNGSGKSSLFWALYTFLQSSVKDNAGIQKYFKYFDDDDENTHQGLLNIFENEGEDAYIELKIKNENGPDKIFKISHDDINTNIPATDNTIQLFNISSDFINYKLLHNFFRASHKNEVNLWQVFERDIFPFLMDEIGTTSLLEKIKNITKDIPRTPNGYPVSNGSRRKNNFIEQLNTLNNEIEGLLVQIQENANDFIKKHFFDGKDVIEIQMEFKKKFEFDNVKRKLWNDDPLRYSKLQIKLLVKVYEEATNSWRTIHRVHSFLNEAQLTRIAIGVRIGALRTRPQTTEEKILVLDDMLISLDMSNRMQIIKMILNEDNNPELQFFDNFQKIILTHDKGFYELIKRHTSPNQWKYFNLRKDESDNLSPIVSEDRTWIDKAQDYLAQGKIDECGFALRKETETLVSKYLKGLNEAAHNGDFEPLNNQLNRIADQIIKQERLDFRKVFVDKSIPLDTIKKLATDFESDDALDANQIGRLRGLRSELINYLIKQYETHENKDRVIADIKDILKRVMNPASHAGLTTLYEGELETAIEEVKKLNQFLNGN
ncbi:MAG: AAA family ATPase [Flavobacteriales bacterium]|nr:MAG: AAA family ATPase [Flavobacteriales bacterium]